MYSWGLLFFVIVSARASPLKSESSDAIIHNNKQIVNDVPEYSKDPSKFELEIADIDDPSHYDSDFHIEQAVNDVPEHSKDPSNFESEIADVDDPSHYDSEFHNEEVVNDVPEHSTEPSEIESEIPDIDDPSHHDSEFHNEEHGDTNEVFPEDTSKESNKQPIIYILELILPPYPVPAFPSLPSLPSYLPNISWLSKLKLPYNFPNIFSKNDSDVILVEAPYK